MKSFLLFALTLLLAGCFVPQTFPKLIVRGVVVDASSGAPVPHAEIVFTLGQPTGWTAPPGSPKRYGEKYATDENGRFDIELSAELKVRPLIDRYDQFPTMKVYAPGYEGGGVFPSYIETKNPYAKELVIKLKRLEERPNQPSEPTAPSGRGSS